MNATRTAILTVASSLILTACSTASGGQRYAVASACTASPCAAQPTAASRYGSASYSACCVPAQPAAVILVPQTRTIHVDRPVEVEVEKIVEVEKVVEVEKIVEVEKPVYIEVPAPPQTVIVQNALPPRK